MIVPAVRAFTDFMVLADAINRAGSIDSEKIRKALSETNMPSDRLIVPWRGITFGAERHSQARVSLAQDRVGIG